MSLCCLRVFINPTPSVC